MNWRKVAVLIVALLITAILGWLSNPKVAETRLESADYWVSYSVGDEVLSGWTIDYADLDIMHLRFDNIGLVVDILTSQVE